MRLQDADCATTTGVLYIGPLTLQIDSVQPSGAVFYRSSAGCRVWLLNRIFGTAQRQAKFTEFAPIRIDGTESFTMELWKREKVRIHCPDYASNEQGQEIADLFRSKYPGCEVTIELADKPARTKTDNEQRLYRVTLALELVTGQLTERTVVFPMTDLRVFLKDTLEDLTNYFEGQVAAEDRSGK